MSEDKKNFVKKNIKKVICYRASGKEKIISTRTRQKEFIKNFNIYWYLCQNQFKK